jgi:transcriptional regulator with XRE-family HTH domain
METVRDARERLSFTQEELAERCGCHATTISHIERGREQPSLELFAHMARELKITPTRLLTLLRKPSIKRGSTSVTDIVKERERRERERRERERESRNPDH